MLFIYGRGKEQQNEKATALKAYQAAASINPHIHPDLLQGISRLGGGPAPVAAVAVQPALSVPNRVPLPVVPLLSPAAPVVPPNQSLIRGGSRQLKGKWLPETVTGLKKNWII